MIAPLIYRSTTRKLIQQLKFSDQVYLANVLVTHLQDYFTKHNVEA